MLQVILLLISFINTMMDVYSALAIIRVYDVNRFISDGYKRVPKRTLLQYCCTVFNDSLKPTWENVYFLSLEDILIYVCTHVSTQ